MNLNPYSIAKTYLQSLVLLLISNIVLAIPDNSLPSIPITPPPIQASAHLLLEHNSHKVLAEHNSHEKVEPASLTKMMTIYVVDHELKQQKLSLNDRVTISQKAWQAPGSRMFLEVGSSVTVDELIKGIIIQSGNDASIALAEHIAGSESSFVHIMNLYAQRLGMASTEFKNVTGLPQKGHLTTAADMALLAQALINEFPDSYKLYAEKEFTYHGITQQNRNRLLWKNHTVDGIKTGHTDSAGYCLVASGKVQDMRLIAVILGAKNDAARTNETNKLLTWGFRFFQTKQLYQSGTPLQNASIWLGNQTELPIGVNDDIFITVPNGDYQKLSASLELPKVLKAPVQKGDILGTYKVQLHGESLIEKDIIALESIHSGSLWNQFKDLVTLTVMPVIDKFKG